MKYNMAQPPTRFINLVIPNNTSYYIFFGEVTFLNGGSKSCDLAAMPIQDGKKYDLFRFCGTKIILLSLHDHAVIQVISGSQTDHDSLSTLGTSTAHMNNN